MTTDRMVREPLSSADAAWLHMEDPTNLMMVTGILRFDERIDVADLRAVLEERLLRFERFRQRVVEPHLALGRPHWETDPHFDLDAHLHVVGLPPPGDEEALRTMVGDLMSRPLDFTKPLWEVHLVEGVAGGGSAVLTRLHHCIADGIALVRVVLSLTDTAAQPGRRRRHEAEHPGPSTVATLVHGGLEALAHPEHAVDAARHAAAGVASLARLTLMPPDTQTVLKGPLGTVKRVAWSPPYPLAPIKEMRAATGCTVNDVLVAALAGALRRYLLSRGEVLDGRSVRATVPVNLRPLDEPLRLGNAFGLVFLSLPVGVADPLDRLFTVKHNMEALKGSPEPLTTLTVLRALGNTPTEVERLFTGFFGSKATAVVTNVPGPREPLFMAGHRVRSVMAWVPQSGHLGLGVSIVSYVGEVHVGVAADARLLPDPQTLVGFFNEELEELVSWARRAPHGLEAAPVPAQAAPARRRVHP